MDDDVESKQEHGPMHAALELPTLAGDTLYRMWPCGIVRSGQRMGDEDYQRHKIDYSASVWHLFCIAIIGVRSCHSEGMGGSEGSLAAEQLIILLCDLGSDRSNAPSDQSAKLPTRSDQRWLILLYFLKKTKFVIEMTS
jgi:hypothetical protein